MCLFDFLHKQGKTRTDDKCFFSLEISDGQVVRRLARSYRHLTIPCLKRFKS